ncbi:MAG: ribonuclease HII, partial [Minisyncoccia bacterium]
SRYLYQETIIKGDEKELSIALASIVAKVARDKKMVALAKKFPEHGFEKHKGYGTRAHYEAIKKHGITKHHRKSFLKGLL